MIFTGNRTECALLLLVRSWGLEFRVIREELDCRLHQVRFKGKDIVWQLGTNIHLSQSDCLIRLCSPRAAVWVLIKQENEQLCAQGT